MTEFLCNANIDKTSSEKDREQYFTVMHSPVIWELNPLITIIPFASFPVTVNRFHTFLLKVQQAAIVNRLPVLHYEKMLSLISQKTGVILINYVWYSWNSAVVFFNNSIEKLNELSNCLTRHTFNFLSWLKCSHSPSLNYNAQFITWQRK